MSQLLHEIAHHLASTGEAESRFGRRVVKDPRLVSDLRRGHEPKEATCARVRAAIADYPRGGGGDGAPIHVADNAGSTSESPRQ